jgi:predicted metal-binding membrane protein
MSTVVARPSLALRERVVVVVALGSLTLLAWIYLVARAGEMGGDGMSMQTAGIQPWTAADFLLTFLMWVVMMVGMMVPSAMPATLLHAGVARKARADGTIIAPTMAFVGGYLLVWALFCIAATAVQGWLESLALLSPTMVSTSPFLGAGLLTLAGAYQLTPAKRACLSHCRSPVHFLSQHWHPGVAGTVRTGMAHGLYCLGCCWALMLLLFVGGVMNLLWVAAIAFFVLVEKLPGRGWMPSWLTGTAMIAAGVVLLLWGR